MKKGDIIINNSILVKSLPAGSIIKVIKSNNESLLNDIWIRISQEVELRKKEVFYVSLSNGKVATNSLDLDNFQFEIIRYGAK